MNYPELLRQIMNEGTTQAPAGREIREVVKTRLVVEPDCNIYAWPVARPLGKIASYLWHELAWYLSGDRDVAHISPHARLWDKIKNPDGTANSNYGHLVFYNKTKHPSLGNVTVTPFQWAFRSLKNDLSSRQAVITYNTGGFNFDGNYDYICTQHQAFLVRNNILRCFVALRSSDAIFGLTFNMPWWSLVQQQLLHELRFYYPSLQLGPIEVDIYSAHVYAQHYKLVEAMISEKPHRYQLRADEKIPISNKLGIEWYNEHLAELLSIHPTPEAAT